MDQNGDMGLSVLDQLKKNSQTTLDLCGMTFTVNRHVNSFPNGSESRERTVTTERTETR